MKWITLFALLTLIMPASWPQTTQSRAARVSKAEAASGQPVRQVSIPHLRKQGNATQLIVGGKPFIMLAGELHNSSASSLAYMAPIWPKLKALNLNTVLATVSWELLEAQEGKYEFGLVDGLITMARRHGLKLVFLWFGSWKNGVSTYAPMWVKTDLKRFPRARSKSGVNMDVISPFSRAACDADARAFAALMRHIGSVDTDRTVLMMQVENEVGLLGETRDRSPLAQEQYLKPVPSDLMNYLQANRGKLIEEMEKVWADAGYRTSGTWAEVFGDNPFGDEVFMAWHYARYIGRIVAAGKAEHPIPMYVNAWLVQNPKQLPGSYPSGGPVSRMLDVWRAAAPQIDFLAPDIYLSDFKGICASYSRSGNPLFIPEASRGAISAANVFWAIAQHDAIGFAPFGIDSVEGNHSLRKSYEVLTELMPVITKYNGTGKMVGLLETNQTTELLTLGDYTFLVDYGFGRRSEDAERQKGYGLLVEIGPGEYLIAGSGVSLRLGGVPPDPKGSARIGWIDEGRFVDGKWVPGRRLNGDENAGGNRVILRPGEVGIQRFLLYRHD